MSDAPEGAANSSGSTRLGVLRKQGFSGLGGVVLLVAALSFYYLAGLRIDFAKTRMFDLFPAPDAIEYFAQATSLATRGDLRIQIGNDRLPSRYPPGYSIAMLPWLEVLPQASKILAPFRTNQSLGLLLILGAFVIYALRGRLLAGGFAALLLATLPGFFTYCRAPLSEITAAASVALVFALVYFGLRQNTRWQLYLAAVVLGLALSIRVQLISFAPLLVAMALLEVKRSRARWFFDCASVLVVFAAAVSPMLLQNTLQLGSPWKSGYNFWLSARTVRPNAFAIAYAAKHAALLWSQVALRPYPFGVANLFGTGTYFTPAFALLVCVGCGFLRPSRFVFAALLSTASFCISTALFFFVDGRFYLPFLVVLVAVAVLPLEWASRAVAERKYVAAALLVFVIGAAAVVGFPSQSGFPPERPRWQAKDALALSKTAASPSRGAYRSATEFARAFGASPGVVLSDIDPVYLNAVLPPGFVAAPIDDKHNYRFSAFWRYGPEQAAALVAKSAAANVPAYALLSAPSEVEKTLARLPRVEGYAWTRSPAKSAAIVLSLVREH